MLIQAKILSTSTVKFITEHAFLYGTAANLVFVQVPFAIGYY